MSSTYWLVAGWRSRFAVLASPRTVAHGDRDVNVPGSSFRALALGVELLGALHFLYFLSCFRSPYPLPLLASPKSHVRPEEKKSARCCWFESRNDSEFIARNSAFYRPNLLSYWSITFYVDDTSLPVRNVSSPHTCIFDINFLHNYHGVTNSVVPSSRLPRAPYTNTYFMHYS